MNCPACVAAYRRDNWDPPGLPPAQRWPDVQCPAKHPRCAIYDAMLKRISVDDPYMAEALALLRDTLERRASKAPLVAAARESIRAAASLRAYEDDPRAGPDR